MSILNNNNSITRYKVSDIIRANNKSVNEKIREGLTKNIFNEIKERSQQDYSIGWTSIKDPYEPNFENPESFLTGIILTISMRIDSKKIPKKVFEKHMSIHEKEYLNEKVKRCNICKISKGERKEIKNEVISKLLMKTIPTPEIYDVIWNIEKKFIFLFTTKKQAREEFETLFKKSFNLDVEMLFPFTMAENKNFPFENIVNAKRTTFFEKVA